MGKTVASCSLVFLLVLFVSCGGGGGGGGCAFGGGNYQGSASDNVLGDGIFVASIIQNGCSISGSAESCFNSGCSSGDIEGTIDGNSFSFTIFIDGSCVDHAQGSLSGNNIAGSYARQGCNIGGGGNFVAARS